jgi:membrane-associated phospholipid phosphatase
MVARKVTRAAKSVTAAESKVAKATAKHRDNPLVEIISKLSEAGDQPQLRTISGGMIVAGLVLRRRQWARAGVRMLIAHELATAMKNFVKNRVDRTRPRSAERREDSAVRRGDHSAKEETSFPSGHTAGAVAVAQAFAREFPEHSAAARVAAAAIGAAQVPRCAHYPTDVGAGALIGVAAEAGVAQLWSAVERLPERVTPEAPQPLPLPV